jgi:uncharacterized protein YjiK
VCDAATAAGIGAAAAVTRAAAGCGEAMPKLVARAAAKRKLVSRAAALLALLASPLMLAASPAVRDPATVEWALPELLEPSGIVWHPGRRTLFVAGDDGDLGEVSVDGKLLRRFHLGGDLEAITVDPATGLLYVAHEGREWIYEVRPDDFKTLRRITIDRTWKGDPNFLRRGGDGVEGLTFVPDDKDPEGGRFWAVNQYDPPVLVELATPLRSSKEKMLTATIVRVVPVSPAPLSEVTWKSDTREFLVLSAIWRRVAVLDADGNFERSVHVPGFMPEGLTRLPDGRIVIAQDSGGLVLWKPDGDPFRADVASGPPAPAPGQAPGAARTRH